MPFGLKSKNQNKESNNELRKPCDFKIFEAWHLFTLKVGCLSKPSLG